jgi:hypothetical protein
MVRRKPYGGGTENRSPEGRDLEASRLAYTLSHARHRSIAASDEKFAGKLGWELFAGLCKPLGTRTKGLPLVDRNPIGQRDQSGDYIKTKAKNGTAPS